MKKNELHLEILKKGATGAQLCIRMDKVWVAKIKKQAEKMSARYKIDLTVSDLVREAIYNNWIDR